MNILGLHDGKDAGVALVQDGSVVFAANEERYSRRKLHFGFPFAALQRLHEFTGVRPKDIDYVAIGFEAMVEQPGAGYDYTADSQTHRQLYAVLSKYFSSAMDTKLTTRAALQFLKLMSRKHRAQLRHNLSHVNITSPLRFFNHHLAHAASAHFTSGQDGTLVLTSDGGGDAISGGVYTGLGNKIQRHSTFTKLNSAGIFWELITQLCGFNPERHGGKITGLAAYSDGEQAYRILNQLYTYNPKSGGINNIRKLAFHDAFKLIHEKTKGLSIEDISSGAQRLLEDCFLQTVRDAYQRTGIGNLALAGGTFANVRLNQRLFQVPGIESIHIHPHMGDGGVAVGSALLMAADLGEAQPHQLKHVYLGDEWSDQDIRLELNSTDEIHYVCHDAPADAIAQCLADHNVVGVFWGRMEYGPRALGHRSILAEPTDSTMMDWLNKRLARTEFMPFAPVILEEEAPQWFEDFDSSSYAARFMTTCFNCTSLCREKAPGVVHIDGTARPQSVRLDNSPHIYRILSAYQRKTGLPLAVNTSFNKHEEPIVGSPADAIDELKRNAVDVLFLNNYEVRLVRSRAHATLECAPCSPVVSH